MECFMIVIKGYDAWKLRTPEEDYEASGGKICQHCGAWNRESCEMEDDCLWVEQDEPDPDYWNDLKAERERD